jgi:VanZ family protein
VKIRRHHIWPFALAFAIFLASGSSQLAAPKVGFSYDKLAHFLVFGLVATSVMRIPIFMQRNWNGALKVIFLISLYGVLDEYRQSFTVGRSVEFDDWIADTSGALLASVLYLKWHWYRRLLEWRCFGKKPKVVGASCSHISGA